MKYLFICGCPRSGTTALWRQFISHKDIAMGVERFILKSNTSFSLEPHLYSKERFFKYKKNDTHFPNLTDGLPGKYYQELQNYFDTCSYVGDKIPVLYRHYSQFFKKFPEAKIIFIFRNIFDVAHSYKVRLNNENDSWKKGISDAVDDWNQSLQNTLKAMDGNEENFFIIEYEDLFFESEKKNIHTSRLSKFLNLPMTQEFEIKLNNHIIQSKALDNDRKLNLTTSEKQIIMHNADFKSYKQILEIAFYK